MKLRILGSSSSGNCYLLETEKETLIIECGVSDKEIIKALEYDISKIAGVIVTHSHLDHSASAGKMADRGVDIYMTSETSKSLNLKGHRIKIVEPLKQFDVGNFKILPFQTKHDCLGSVGFLIYEKSLEITTLFATDTFYIEYIFENLNNILIECNYAKDILYKNVADGIITKALKDRTLKSHFELENVKGFLKANDLLGVRNICLLHLSDRNSDAGRFREEIEELTGINTTIADKGVEIDLSLYPF